MIEFDLPWLMAYEPRWKRLEDRVERRYALARAALTVSCINAQIANLLIQ